MRLRLPVATLLIVLTPRCFAPPPLVTGDVPTADKGRFEWYMGTRYQESQSGKPQRLLPFSELVYGLSERQEVTFETAGLSEGGHYGLRDSVVGTKYLLMREGARNPGLAGSFEIKLPTGSESRGLGSGEFEYEFRLRAQKTCGWFTGIGNLGHTLLTDSELNGERTHKMNSWLASFAQEYQVGPRTKLLSEVYFVSREEPADPHRLAANIGFKHKLRDDLAIHGAIGKSLREGNRGGPDVRVYLGLKWEF